METVLILITLWNLVLYEIANQSHDFCPYSQFRRGFNATCVFYGFVCHNQLRKPTKQLPCPASQFNDKRIEHCGTEMIARRDPQMHDDDFEGSRLTGAEGLGIFPEFG